MMHETQPNNSYRTVVCTIMKRSMQRIGRTSVGLLLACNLLAVACAPITTPPAATPAGEATRSLYAATELTFAGNGNTFLAAIEEAAAGARAHQFVEVTDVAGATWQGELLTFDDAAQLFLQQAQQGGSRAVRLDGPVDFDPAAALGLLPPAAAPLDSPHPEIRFVRAARSGDTWRFDVTLAYPDTGWEDYADGWHVATPAGDILGTRILLHPHVNEQPFTRSLSGVSISPDVAEIVIRSHDLVSGYSPEVLTLPLDAANARDRYEVVIE